MFEISVSEQTIQDTIDSDLARDCCNCAIYTSLKVEHPDTEFVDFEYIKIGDRWYLCSYKLYDWQEQLCNADKVSGYSKPDPITIVFDTETAKIKGE